MVDWLDNGMVSLSVAVWVVLMDDWLVDVMDDLMVVYSAAGWAAM